MEVGARKTSNLPAFHCTPPFSRAEMHEEHAGCLLVRVHFQCLTSCGHQRFRALEPGGVVRVVRSTRLTSKPLTSFTPWNDGSSCQDVSCASKEHMGGVMTHAAWRRSRFRCRTLGKVAGGEVGGAGDEFRCKGQADDASLLLALMERVGFQQYGAGADGHSVGGIEGGVDGEGNAVHTLWPAMGNQGAARIFHMSRPALIT